MLDRFARASTRYMEVEIGDFSRHYYCRMYPAHLSCFERKKSWMGEKALLALL
jgi:hypothetical protein